VQCTLNVLVARIIPASRALPQHALATQPASRVNTGCAHPAPRLSFCEFPALRNARCMTRSGPPLALAKTYRRAHATTRRTSACGMRRAEEAARAAFERGGCVRARRGDSGRIRHSSKPRLAAQRVARRPRRARRAAGARAAAARSRAAATPSGR
jgi:hypothetical protein